MDAKKNTESVRINSVSVNAVDYIILPGHSLEHIEKAKKQLIKRHVEKAMSTLEYTKNETTKKMCESRLFFVKKGDRLVLCGLYKVSEKFDKIGPFTKHYSQVCDYLLYSEIAGFYFVHGCSSPINDNLNSKNTSPSIYYQTEDTAPYIVLQYGETIESDTLKNVQVKYNIRNYYPEEKKTFHIVALINTTVVHEIKCATLFSELPLVPNHYIYTTEKDHMGWLINASLVDYVNSKKYSLQCQGGYAFHYDYYSTLSCVMVDLYKKQLCISDEENYYFYISKTDTVAYDDIMQCVNKYGKVDRLDNLIPYDSTVNYRIAIPKQAPPNVASFIFGAICKSNVVHPAIMGCPIHDVVEILCSYERKEDNQLPKSFDYISAENTVYLLKKQFGDIPYWKIIYLITSCYGSYSSRAQFSKYWMYFHGVGLRESINGDYLRNLQQQTIAAKWVSEFLLYKNVLFYYSDAVMHYNSEWLGHQHLDIFVPSISLGIEFQGQQHYEPNEFFGGEIGFSDRQFLDEKKRQLCKNNKITLLEWPYTTPINAANLITQLLRIGICNIPIPDPFRIPQKYEESIPEEKIAISIRKYDLDGKLLHCYNSYKDASEANGISLKAITKAVYGYSKTAGGYQWRREVEGTPKSDIEPLNPITSTGLAKAVLQVSLEGEVVAEYPSISKASKAVGINSKSISCVLNGTQRTAGKYYWVYKETD